MNDEFDGAKSNRFFRPSLAIELKVEHFKYDHEYLCGPSYYDIPILRVYTHETIHFWQTLSQGYVTNLALSEWCELSDYEQSKESNNYSSVKNKFYEKSFECQFSPRDLIEALARYWDIHIVGVKNLLKWGASKQLLKKPFPTERIKNIDSKLTPTTSEDFDLLIENNESYTLPYKLTIEKLGTHNSVIVFPIVAHFSLQSRNPALVFAEIINILKNSNLDYGGNIHDGWNKYFGMIKKISSEVAFKTTGSLLTTGFDVISRSKLKENPLYLHFSELLSEFYSTHGEKTEFYFALPGDPKSRSYLLGALQPPLVLFLDGYWERNQTLLEEYLESLKTPNILQPKDLAEVSLGINKRYRKYLRWKTIQRYSSKDIQ